jgi:hypothetical protein
MDAAALRQRVAMTSFVADTVSPWEGFSLTFPG